MTMLQDAPVGIPTVDDERFDADDLVEPGLTGPEPTPPRRPPRQRRPARMRRDRGATLTFLTIAFFCTLIYATLSKPSLGGFSLGNIFDSGTTATGGDMGSHVWAPDFARRELLPHLSPLGWTNDWYAGFPALQFYFPLPSWMIALGSFILPYNVAFKLVTALGLFLMPLAAWSFGRNAGLKRPYPALLGMAVVPFVFVRRFWIYGGNIMSTMAGEFSFSNSLCTSFLFLGLYVKVIRTGKRRGWAAAAFAATALSHLLPTIFAVILASMLFITHVDAKRWKRQILDSALVTGVGLAITGFWTLPFQAKIAYSNTMGFELDKKVTYIKHLFPWLETQKDIRPGANIEAVATVLAVIGAVAAIGSLLRAIVRANKTHPNTWRMPTLGVIASVSLLVPAFFWNQLKFRNGAAFTPGLNAGNVIPRMIQQLAYNSMRIGAYGAIFLFLTTAVLGWTVRGWNRIGVALTFTAFAYVLIIRYSSRDFRLWNARALPFWVLCLFLLAAYGFATVGRGILAFARWLSAGQRTFPRAASTATIAGAALTFSAIALPLGLVPGWVPVPKIKKGLIGIQQAKESTDRTNADGWPRYNYEGYQKREAWPELRSLMDTMQRVGKERGCGRAMWENAGSGADDLGRFGTPMALMLLPYFTKSCIGSMEGLYFESSATTPYHFMNASLLGKAPSKAQRDLPYSDSYDVDKGVKKLQEFGVRYFLAFSDVILEGARRNPALTQVATSGRFTVFQVADSDLVSPLPYEPAVATGIGPGQNEGWLDMGTALYNAPQLSNNVPMMGDGPKEWQRRKVNFDEVKLAEERKASNSRTAIYGHFLTIDTPTQKPLPTVRVTNIVQKTTSLSFNVDRPGVPVLVKISYFPNWKANGARGPWRVAPNFMVVIPTKNSVTLDYGLTGTDYVGRALSLGAIGGLFLLRRADRRRPDDDPDLDPDLDTDDEPRTDTDALTADDEPIGDNTDRIDTIDNTDNTDNTDAPGQLLTGNDSVVAAVAHGTGEQSNGEAPVAPQFDDVGPVEDWSTDPANT